ncbi:hypothetical protein Q5P01_006700 [Channa striata]|uniref:Uncharacterized protein n=1 Tax=Channa striata TaxID=64152 RepID=A0AA88NBW4_CHASR|nr:hypothetical protein Q5P01_006700 [Channa striata]
MLSHTTFIMSSHFLHSSVEDGLLRQAEIDLLKTRASQLEAQSLMGSTALIQHRVTQHGLPSAQLMERTKELKEDYCSTLVWVSVSLQFSVV